MADRLCGPFPGEGAADPTAEGGSPYHVPRSRRAVPVPRQPRVPRYTLHKPTGQADVRLDGKDPYLGRFGTPASRTCYDGLIAAWLAARSADQPFAAPP